MKYTDTQIDLLRREVCQRLSEKRFNHTLGVEKMAVLVGGYCMPESIDKLRVAALLHDISKEYSEAEYFEIVKQHNITMSEDDLAASPIWHSITAPCVVKSDFPEFADSDILSAVYNHTVGSPDMSVFDEIILLSDYIEEGRTYKNCVALREKFLAALEKTTGTDEAIMALHMAILESLDNNINEFVSRGKGYHHRTALTRDAIKAKTERLS